MEEDLDYTNCEDVKNNTQCIQVFRKYGIKLDIDINRDKTDIRKFMELNAKNSADHLPYEIVKQWDYEKNK